jgi:hypothetical protein
VDLGNRVLKVWGRWRKFEKVVVESVKGKQINIQSVCCVTLPHIWLIDLGSKKIDRRNDQGVVKI